jgi:catechol 2,3-dioxygenase-like lactoylglutathione lyase family enzyme
MGADRQTSIDFWQGVLGMPLVFEQPNLDDETQNHLYFDPGDGRLITVFTSEDWVRDQRPVPLKAGSLHHIAFTVSLATWRMAVGRLKERRIASSGEVDRGFMHSIYFRDPLGQLIELACYKFEPPAGYTHSDVLSRAHAIRLVAGAKNIEEVHLADAIAVLSGARGKGVSPSS